MLLASEVTRADPAGKFTNVPNPYGDFKKHINVILKDKWQFQWNEAVNNKLPEIHPQLGLWPRGFRIIKREESVFSKIKNWPYCDCRLTVKLFFFIVLILLRL